MESEGFYARVYSIVSEIPRGKVATYGQIARMLGVSRWGQIVGFALHENPDTTKIPCHRVVNRFGQVCNGFAFGGGAAQRKLLESEGIVFEKNGSIDLNKYLWEPSLFDANLDF